MRAASLAFLLPALLATPGFASGLQWGPETNLSGTTTDSETGLSHRPIVTDADGVVHAVWAERDGPGQTYRIHTRRRIGGAWTPTELLVDYLEEDPGGPGDDLGAKYPSLAAAADGEVHLFWHDYRSAGIENAEIYWKSRPAGGTWNASRGADVRLTTSQHPETNGDNSYVPSAVVGPGGDVHVAWYDYRFDGWNAEILAKTRPTGGAWDLTPGDAADDRVTNDAGHSELVDLAVDSAGDVHAVWRSTETGGRIRYARRDATSGQWSANVLVDSAATVQGGPAIAVDGDDTVHVFWPDGRDGGRSIYTRTRSSAGTWSHEMRLTDPGDGADEPAADVDGDGTLHLVFSDRRVSILNAEIFLRTLPAGGAWDTTGATDVRISAASGTSSRPSVDAADGVVTVLWRDARDGNREIYVRRGEPDPTGAPDASGTPLAWRVAPNPTRGTVRLLRPTAAPAPVRIVDVAGRPVRTLRPEDSRWDLRAADGRRVSSGVYFLRTPDGSTARVTVLR